MGWLNDMADTIGVSGQDRLDEFTTHPGRWLLPGGAKGATPLEAKVTNSIFGSEEQPVVDQMGGITQRDFARARRQGIDTRNTEGLNTTLDTIAAIIGGYEAFGALGWGFGGEGAEGAVAADDAASVGGGLSSSGYSTGPVEDASGNLYNAGATSGNGTSGLNSGMYEDASGNVYNSNLDVNGQPIDQGVGPNGEYPSNSYYDSRNGASNAMDNEPGGNWNSKGSTPTSGKPGGGGTGTPSSGWESWAKTLGVPLGFAALNMIAAQRNAKKQQQADDQRRADYLARRAQMDEPGKAADISSNIGKLGPMSQTGADLQLAGYGYHPETQSWTMKKSAHGGLAMHGAAPANDGPVGGLSRMVGDHGGGQQDNVPAMLSSKEYVFDADTVSAIGDGNPDEGARRLDEFRRNLRMHKRGAPASKIPPKTRPLHSYLRAA